MQLTVRGAAKFLNVSEKAVYQWVSAGEIPVYRIDGQCRFNSTELLEWATTRRLKVSTRIFRPREEGGGVPAVAQALETGGIHYKLVGADKNLALRSMVDALRLPEKIDRSMLYEVLAARESLGTAAIGKGIAIPHVRNPLVLKVDSAMIALFFLEKPVDFGALDGQPVHTLFWLIASTVKTHLLMLSRLASVINNPSVQVLLARRAPADEILTEIRRVESALGQASGGSA